MKKILTLLLMLLCHFASVAQGEFITVWDMSKPGNSSNQITFNLTYTAPVAYTWTASGGNTGSGTTTGTITGLPAGETITLLMDPVNLKAFSTQSGTDQKRLIDVNQWGTVAWSSMQSAFSGCLNLNITATDVPDLSNVTNMLSMFTGCHVLNGPVNIGSWDTSKVTNMDSMFYEAFAFNQNISSWDTSQVTDMSYMFANTTAFNQNIGAWDTSNVTNMMLMFFNANTFNQSIGNWNTANVTDMSYMFNGATAFNQDLGNWQLNSVNNNMSGMLDNSGMDCANYSATLMRWANNPDTPNGISFGAEGISYGTNAVAARDALMAKNWTITGDSNSGTICTPPRPFITVWDMNKHVEQSANTNNIVFNMTSTAPVAYTWTASGGSNGSGTTTTGIITGLPSEEIITLSMDPANLQAITFSTATPSPTTEFRLINVAQWGTVAWSSMQNAFNGCFNLNITATDVPDLSNVTNMTSMFYGCTSLSGPANIGSWDTSKVTNMEAMFAFAATFNQDISSWDTSKVTNMEAMFYYAAIFNQNIGNWEMVNVTNMRSMFHHAFAFNGNIGSWNTINVTNMSSMFALAFAFNQDIGSWNTSQVTSMNGMFASTIAFNQNISTWNTSQVINMGEMFYSAEAFNQNIGNWQLNSVTEMSSMLGYSGMDCTNYSATLMGWANNPDTPNGISLGAEEISYGTNAVAARNTLITTKGWTIIGDSNSGTSCTPPRPFITVWDMGKPASSTIDANTVRFFMVSTAPVAYTWTASGGGNGSGTTTTGIITGLPANEIITLRMEPANLRAISFDSSILSITTNSRLIDVAQWGTVVWSNMTLMFNGCGFLNITATDVPDLSKVTNMSSMFNGCRILNSPANMGSWDTSNVTNMSFMFSGAIQFNQNIGNWNTTNVTDMSQMFNVAPVFNQDIGNWNTANVTNMDFMFSGAMSFKQNIGNWDTSKVTDMRNMFSGALSFNQNISNWNTANVTDMSQMFHSAISFNQNIGNWNTTKVTDMRQMFIGAKTFNQNIGNWDTSNVTDINGMFGNATAFNGNIGTWNTSKVTDMKDVFQNATLFNQNIGNWDTANVTNMGNMFDGAKVFNQDISNWDIANVTDMGSMFNGAKVFNQDISNWNTAKVVYMGSMFSDAIAFNQNISSWNTANVTSMSSMFLGATAFNQNIGNWQLNSVVDMSAMLDNSGMDCTNYSVTLMGWADNPDTPDGISFGAEDILYGTNAVAARNTLTTTKGWIIEGDTNSGNNCGTPQTLTVADMTKTYGDAPFIPNATASSGLEVSYESADNSIAEAFQDNTDGNKWKIRIHKAGVVTITAKQAGNSLYEPAPDVPFVFTINKAALSVTADAQTKVYGTTDPIRTYQTNGFVNNDTQAALNGALSRTTGEAVGIYAIDQGSLSADNYTITYTGADFTITKARLNIAADAKTKAYGTTDPVLTYTLTGLANDDDANVITGTLTRVVGENIGIYTIEQGTLEATTNYDIAYTSADFTITKATLNIVAEAKTKQYGTTDPVLTYTVTGLANDDDANVITGNLTRTTGENIGTYAIEQGSLTTTANYDITYTSADFTITKATLNIVADAKTKQYGTTDPVLTYTVSGLANGDDSNVITGNLTRTAGENIGTYTIEIGTLNAMNYSIAYIGTDFIIVEALLVNSFTQSDVTCNGANNGSATVVVTGGTTPYTYNWLPTGGTEATANGLTAGTYTVTITDANGFVVTQEFTITEPPVVAPPTAEPVQTFCASQNITISELQAQGSQIKWYATADAMTELPTDTVLIDGTTYYASQTINGCESIEKTAVQVTISELPESPTGATTQSFTVNNIGEATIADLVMDQENVIWYISLEDAMTGNNPLAAEIPLENGQTYYAVLTNTNGCSSLSTAVTVDITLSTDKFDPSGLKYYPNPTRDILTIEYKNSMDRVTVYNLLGQKVLTQEANSKEVQLNMSTLANGSYVIEIRSKKQTQFVKVVKK